MTAMTETHSPELSEDFIISALINLVDDNNEGAFRELVDNSEDYGAEHIMIQIDNRKAVILDDGRGADAIGRAKLLNLGNVQKRLILEGVKGQFGMGFKTIIVIARKIVVETVSIKDPSVVARMEFTDRELVRSWLKKSDVKIQTTFVPKERSGFPFETGMRITISDFRENRAPNPDLLINELGRKLDALHAKKIRVNTRKLKYPEIYGQRIKYDGDYLGVRIACDIGLAQQLKRTDMPLSIHAYGRITSLVELQQGLTHTQQARFSEITRYAMGWIRVENFNNYMLQGRQGLKMEQLRNSTDFARFLDWVELWLNPELEKAMGAVHTAEIEKEDITIVSTFCNEISERTGIKPDIKKPADKTSISIDPRQITLLTSGKRPLTYKINGINPAKGKVHIETSECGGRIEWRGSSQFDYFPGATPGRYTLTLWQEGQPEDKVIAHIHLVKEYGLKVVPKQRKMKPGMQVVFWIENHESLSEDGSDFRWSVTGGTLAHETGLANTFTSGEAFGTHYVTVEYGTGNSKKIARSRITISPEGVVRRRQRDTVRIRIDDLDYTFRIQIVSYDRMKLPSRLPEPNAEVKTIQINRAHPHINAALGRKDWWSKRMAIEHELVTNFIIVADELGHIQGGQYNILRSKLLEMMSPTDEAPKRKRKK